jgi:hypothetical protein
MVAQPGWMHASPPPYTSVNQHKYCMLFQDPQYWGGSHLFQWATPGQYRTRCEENQQTFEALLAIKQKMLRQMQVVVRESWDGVPNNDSNEGTNKLNSLCLI